MKVVYISYCDECPHFNFDDQEDPKKWGKRWCEKLNMNLGEDIGEIPHYCPLPDVGKKKAGRDFPRPG